MKNQNSKVTGLHEDAEAPHWLAAALRLVGDAVIFEDMDPELAETSDGFRVRCREAAGLALAILKLRRERQRVGFLPVSLTDYLQGLVKVAGLSLAQMLAAIGVQDLTFRSPEVATAFGRLALQIGMSLRETLAHLRIDFATERQLAPMAFLVAHRHAGDPRRTQLEDCEEVLLQIESEYDSKSLSDLRSIEEGIRNGYQGVRNDSA